MACYAESDRPWTFYEIDPLVEQIARNPRYFTYLQNSRGRVNIVLGDARVSLQHAADQAYDLIVLDAFSSDAIPMHLLTREAIHLYFSRLRSEGVVAVHISDRYLKLEPVLAALAERDGLFALASLDDRLSAMERMSVSFRRIGSSWLAPHSPWPNSSATQAGALPITSRRSVYGPMTTQHSAGVRPVTCGVVNVRSR
jgi:spermidine synthase